MEGIIGALVFILFALFFIGGFQFLSEKYFGVRFHGKFGYSTARKKSEIEKEQLELLQKIDPESVQRAIGRCKKKKYKLTHGNILNEINKEDPLTTAKQRKSTRNFDFEELTEAYLQEKVETFNRLKPPKLEIEGDPEKIKLAIDICIINGIEPTEENVRNQLGKKVFTVNWKSK